MNCFFINLDQSKSRRIHMESLCTRLEVNHFRVPAIHGSKIMELESWRESVDWQQNMSINITSNEIACFLSHRKAWENIAQGSDRHGVVMEDDIFLSPKAAYFLNNSSWIPKDALIVRLETHRRKIPLGRRRAEGEINGVNYRLFTYFTPRRKFEFGYGAACYAIRSDFAGWLCEHFEKVFGYVDVEVTSKKLLREFAPSFWWRASLQLSPALAIQQQSIDQRFLPMKAETSVIWNDYANSAKVSVKHSAKSDKIIRELRKMFYVSNWKVQLLKRTVPLLQ